MRERSRAEVLVVGAGVIGMATALELADRGLRVRVLERGRPGGESSWAGAGIIYPAFPERATDPFDRLRGESFAAWPAFAGRMEQDVGFHQCGGLVLERTADRLECVAEEHRRSGAAVEGCNPADLEPNLGADKFVGCHLPQVCQVRNPRLVRALAARLEAAGVELLQGVGVRRLLEERGRLVGVESENGDRWHADQVLVTAGAWTAGLLPNHGLEVVPVRGQILLFRPKSPLLARVVEVGKHYFVPRRDGRILVGSTEEHAGFQKAITPAGFDELYAFAVSLVPGLGDAEIEASWAGLRPGTPTGTPYLFEDHELRGLWIAAGHFRLGLQLAPGTARLLADWMTGRPSFAALEDFCLAADRTRYRRSFTA